MERILLRTRCGCERQIWIEPSLDEWIVPMREDPRPGRPGDEFKRMPRRTFRWRNRHARLFDTYGDELRMFEEVE